MTKCLHYRRGPSVDPPRCAPVSALSRRGPGRNSDRCGAQGQPVDSSPAARQGREPQGCGRQILCGSTFPSPRALHPLLPSFLAFSLFGGHSPAQNPSPRPRPSGIRTTGCRNPRTWPPASTPALRPGEASLTRGVNAQTCPQSLPNPQTQPQVLTAPGGCAELRGWVSAHPSPHIPARLPPRRAALLRSWDAGLPRKTYGRYRAGSQVRGSLPKILAQLACGTFLDQLVKTLRASVSLSVKWGVGGSVLRDEDGRESEDISIAEPSRALPSRPHIGS